MEKPERKLSGRNISNMEAIHLHEQRLDGFSRTSAKLWGSTDLGDFCSGMLGCTTFAVCALPVHLLNSSNRQFWIW